MQIPEPLIGIWAGKTPDGEVIIFVFRPDHTLLWKVETGNLRFSVEAQYRVDYDCAPLQIDIFNFNREEIEFSTLCAIAEFKEGGILRLYGEPDGPRPEAFGDDTLVFERLSFSCYTDGPFLQ